MRPLSDANESSSLLPHHSESGYDESTSFNNDYNEDTYQSTQSNQPIRSSSISNPSKTVLLNLDLTKMIILTILVMCSAVFIYKGIDKPSHIDTPLASPTVFSFENGTRIQLRLPSYQYLRVDNLRYDTLVLGDTSPWNRGSTFEMIKANDNMYQDCFYLKSLAAKYITVSSMNMVIGNADYDNATPLALIGYEGDLKSVKIQVCASRSSSGGNGGSDGSGGSDDDKISDSGISSRNSRRNLKTTTTSTSTTATDTNSNTDSTTTTTTTPSADGGTTTTTTTTTVTQWLAFPTNIYERSTDTYAPSMYATPYSELSQFEIIIVDRIKVS